MLAIMMATVAMAQGRSYKVNVRIPAEYKVVTSPSGMVNIRKTPSTQAPVLMRQCEPETDGCWLAWSNELQKGCDTEKVPLSPIDALPVLAEQNDFYKIYCYAYEGGEKGYVGKSVSQLIKIIPASENMVSQQFGYHRFASGPYKGLFVYEQEDMDGTRMMIGAYINGMPVIFREVYVNLIYNSEYSRLVKDEESNIMYYGTEVAARGFNPDYLELTKLDYNKLTPKELEMFMDNLKVNENTEQNDLSIMIMFDDLVTPVMYPLDDASLTKVVHLEGEATVELPFEEVQLPSGAKLDKNPMFRGGVNGLIQFISSTMVYPEEAINNNIKGKVNVVFTIDKYGDVRDAQVVKPAHPLLDREALRVVNSMPRWKPAILDGSTVNVRFTLPINFE